MAKTRRAPKHKRGGFEKPVYLKDNPANNTIFSAYTSKNTKNHETLIKYIKKKYNVKNRQIPIGTRLYRAAFETDPMDLFSSKKDFFFFGLDAYIAVWYALEMWQMFKKNRHNIPYTDWFTSLHEYEVIKPFDYEYLSDITTNPKNDPYYDICVEHPCVHPQIIMHGEYGTLREIGTELTIPYKFPIREYIRPVATYKVNLIKLLEMQDWLTDWEYPFALKNILTPIDPK